MELGPAELAGGRVPGVLARGPWPLDAVTCDWRPDAYDAPPEADAAADRALAELHERGSPTHDGMSARMASHAVAGAGLHIELEPARWSLRLGPDALDSMSALCVVRDADGRWLAGRRAAWVASWPGRWGLGAGGAVDLGESPAATLGRELAEEWGVEPERLRAEALLRLPGGLAMLVGLAHLAPGTEVAMDPEHDRHAWWPPDPDDWPPEAERPLRLSAQLLAG